MKTMEFTKRLLPGTETELTYRLVVDEVTDEAGLPFTESYGIMVSAGGEEKCIRGITVSRDRIFELLEKISVGAVTPTTLADVVIDYIG